MCVCVCVCVCVYTPSRPPFFLVLASSSFSALPPTPPLRPQTSILLNKFAEGQLSIHIGDTDEMRFSSVTFHPNMWYHVVLVHVQV